MAVANFKPSTIWTADNLPIMRGMNDACIDLIYLDPPFNSNKDYAAPIGSEAAGAEFKDTWTLNEIDIIWLENIANHREMTNIHKVINASITDSNKSYLCYMARRLVEMHRLLKSTGSIFLHCDPTMSHWLKIILDCIFGVKKFRNEIVWYYSSGGGRGKEYFSKKHDLVYWYSKTDDYTFIPDNIRVPYKDTSNYAKTGIISKTGKKYMPNPKGKIPDDVWEIPIINPMSNERTGYPTQKPLKLLDKIISASTNANDLVFDPFCGCATTLISAQSLTRNWVGIDISKKAVELIDVRMKKELPLLTYDKIERTDIPERTDIGQIPKYNCVENKQKLYADQSGQCLGCLEHFKIENLEVDHQIPLILGGTDHISNLALLCSHCNKVKGPRDMEYLITKKQKVRDNIIRNKIKI